jgi:hypothetical protein
MRRSRADVSSRKRPYTRASIDRLSREGACRNTNPLLYDTSDPTSDAARRALLRCTSCPLRELCETVVLHEPDGTRAKFTGVAAGAVWLEGRRVTRRPRLRLTSVPTSAALTDWLSEEGDPAELRLQHKRWNAGTRDATAREGERVYQMVRSRMKRAQRSAS